jgi:hypothetical protein
VDGLTLEGCRGSQVRAVGASEAMDVLLLLLWFLDIA